MKRKTASRGTTKNRQLLLEVVLAAPWIAAVAAINVDWQSADLSTTVAAVVSITASAVFWTAALRQRIAAVGVLYGSLALVLVVLNACVAFGNLHRQTVDSRDHRSAIAGTIEERSAQQSRLSEARAEAKAIAGERSPETLRAEIDKLAAENASRWRSTKGCTAGQITLAASAAFCSQIASGKAALAAAQRRDAIDGELARLNRDASVAPAVREADPFGPGVAQLVAAIGWSLTPEAKSLLPTIRDALRAILLELAGTMGPAATISLLASGRDRPQNFKSRRRWFRIPRIAISAIGIAKSAPRTTSHEPKPADGAELFSQFLAERTEAAKGVSTPAGELWADYGAWCRLQGFEPGTQIAFGLRCGAQFRKEGTGRPRYIGVRLIQVEPRTLKIVPRPRGGQKTA